MLDKAHLNESVAHIKALTNDQLFYRLAECMKPHTLLHCCKMLAEAIPAKLPKLDKHDFKFSPSSKKELRAIIREYSELFQKIYEFITMYAPAVALPPITRQEKYGVIWLFGRPFDKDWFDSFMMGLLSFSQVTRFDSLKFFLDRVGAMMTKEYVDALKTLDPSTRDAELAARRRGTGDQIPLTVAEQQKRASNVRDTSVNNVELLEDCESEINNVQRSSDQSQQQRHRDERPVPPVVPVPAPEPFQDLRSTFNAALPNYQMPAYQAQPPVVPQYVLPQQFQHQPYRVAGNYSQPLQYQPVPYQYQSVPLQYTTANTAAPGTVWQPFGPPYPAQVWPVPPVSQAPAPQYPQLTAPSSPQPSEADSTDASSEDYENPEYYCLNIGTSLQGPYLKACRVFFKTGQCPKKDCGCPYSHDKEIMYQYGDRLRALAASTPFQRPPGYSQMQIHPGIPTANSAPDQSVPAQSVPTQRPPAPTTHPPPSDQRNRRVQFQPTTIQQRPNADSQRLHSIYEPQRFVSQLEFEAVNHQHQE